MPVLKYGLWAPMFLAALALAAPAAAAEIQPVYSRDHSDTPVFQLRFLNRGEGANPEEGGNPSSRDWTAPEKEAFIRAARYWADLLFPSSSNGPRAAARLDLYMVKETNNAYAFSDVGSGGAGSNVAEALLNPSFTPSGGYDGLAALGFYAKPDFSPLGQMYGAPYNVENTFIHELGHALGILALPIFNKEEKDEHGDYVDGGYSDQNDSRFGFMIKRATGIGSDWLYVGNGTGVVSNDGAISGFNPNDPAADAVKIYNDYWLNSSPPYYGLPMANDDPAQARSHFGLRNTEMTHRLFRNYAVFVEAELAALKDLGYDFNLRDHFGRSIYTNNNNTSNNNAIDYESGFGLAWNKPDEYAGDGYYQGGPNLTPYATGLHIYGFGNEATVKTHKILADGDGAGGVRVDGWENTLNIETTVTADGPQGTGLLVAYGRDHELTLAETGAVSAALGDAARFDIGVNGVDYGEINADGYGLAALYSHYDNPQTNPFRETDEFADHTANLAGPLVKKFTVKGEISGGRSAIYISPNSHVQEIAIDGDTAVIKGAIISDYDDQWGAAGANLSTALNISGGSQAAPFEVGGAILGYGAKPTASERLGRGYINLTLEENGRAYFAPESRVKVNGFTVENQAELLIQPRLDLQYGAVIGANFFKFEEGSRIGFLTPDLGEGSVYRFNPVLKLERLGSDGPFDREDELNIAGALKINGAEYNDYAVQWWRSAAGQPAGNVLMIDLSGTDLDFGGEAGSFLGGEALDAAAVMALSGAGWRSIQKRARLETGRRDGRNLVAPPAGEEAPSLRLWADIFYSHERGLEDGERRSYRQNAPGAALGAEKWLDENALGGLAFSLGTPQYRSDFLENDGRMLSLAAYGLFRVPDALDLDLILGHSWNDYDQSRRLEGHIYKARYGGRAFRAGAGLSRGLNLGDGFAFTPRLGYDFTRLETHEFWERFNEVFALSVDKSRRNLHRVSLEGELDWRSESGLGLGLRAGWAHLAGDLRGEANAVFQGDPYDRLFRAGSPELEKNALETGLWLDAPIGDHTSFNLGYEGSFSRRVQNHAGEAKLNFRF